MVRAATRGRCGRSPPGGRFRHGRRNHLSHMEDHESPLPIHRILNMDRSLHQAPDPHGLRPRLRPTRNDRLDASRPHSRMGHRSRPTPCSWTPIERRPISQHRSRRRRIQRIRLNRPTRYRRTVRVSCQCDPDKVRSGEWLPKVGLLEPFNEHGTRETPCYYMNFGSAPGATRTPNLLIRRSPSGVHRGPGVSIQTGTGGFGFHWSPAPSTPVQREWLPTWLPRQRADRQARRPSSISSTMEQEE